MTAIVILAAGGSSRLGEPKQRLIYKGRPLLSHVCAIALAAAPDRVTVVLGQGAEELRGLIPKGVSVVVNPDWAEGLSSSIQAGLRDLVKETEVAVLILGDQPLVTPEHLRSLISLVDDRSPIAGSQYPDGQPGVPAAFHRSIFPELLALRGDAGAKAVLSRRPNLRTIPAPPLVDIDTRDDYDRLIRETRT